MDARAVPEAGRALPVADTVVRSFEDRIRDAWPRMSRLAHRLAGDGWEDVLQDALTLAWRKRDRYDPARGSSTSWLLALVVDRAGKSRRSASRRPVSQLLDDPPDDAVATRDLDLDRAITALTQRQRLAVDLYYFLGLPVAEVAEVMHCSVGTVKSTLSDARTRLRTLLAEEET